MHFYFIHVGVCLKIDLSKAHQLFESLQQLCDSIKSHSCHDSPFWFLKLPCIMLRLMEDKSLFSETRNARAKTAKTKINLVPERVHFSWIELFIL